MKNFLNTKPTKSTYILYARKSTEAEDRQIQSIEDQKSNLLRIAKERGFKIIDIIEETKSAKVPLGRPEFNKMIERIKDGEANGILTWQLNRLARNPVDGGTITWLLQTGVIQQIQTYQKVYLPNDNVIMIGVEFSQANQYLLELSRNVRRGLVGKMQRGWQVGPAPLGYKNVVLRTEEHILKPDTKRFSLIRKMWDMMLTGNYTPPQILEIANNEWGFKTPLKKKIGGVPLSKSGIYRIFTNPFYAGIIKMNGVEYDGLHDKMVTLEEYDRVQEFLGRNGNPRSKTKEFAFTGLIRCGTCGCMITAEDKVNRYGRHYTYYHCTKKKNKNGQLRCSERSIELKELEKQIKSELDKITIPDEFREWALESIREENHEEEVATNTISETLHKNFLDIEKKLKKLTTLLLNETLEEDEYTENKVKLEAELKQIKKQIKIAEERRVNWAIKMEQHYVFATEAKKRFEDGDIYAKKDVLQNLGSNFSLKDQKLTIDVLKPLRKIEEGLNEIDAEYNRLELEKQGVTKEQFRLSDWARLHWLSIPVSNHSTIIANETNETV